MSLYDDQCVREFEQLEVKLAPFFAEMAVACPYSLPHEACFYQALFSPLSDRAMELFLAAGYRRNGNCLYTMHCRDCSACVPIRLHPDEVKMNRNQRRVRKKNRDLEIEFAPVEASEENIGLCEKFLKSRYPHKNNDGNSYYQGFFLNHIIPGMEIRYRCQGRLVGNGIVDMGENWMNAVYFFFDPDEGWRSPGIFNILTLVDICLNLNISYLYLGYYIDEVPAMNYKGSFSPHYLYLDSRWRKRGRRP